MFETSARLNEKNPWVSRLLLIITLESHKIGPRVLRAMRKGNDRQFQHLRVVIGRGKELGVFAPDLDVDWAATELWSSTIGVQMLVFIGCVVALSATLIVLRLPHLRSEARLASLLSREAFFLLNNLVLVGLCLVIMWGTFFPLISEAFTGHRPTFGPPMFERLTVPLALVLVLLSGIGPLIAWRRATAATC